MAAAPPTDLTPMQDVVVSPEAPGLAQPAPIAAAPGATVPGVAPPGQEEHACETLYIQNLNEKIKIDGTHQQFPSNLID